MSRSHSPLSAHAVEAGRPAWTSLLGLIGALCLTLLASACRGPAPTNTPPAPATLWAPTSTVQATLQLIKFVDRPSASPGDVLQYSLVVMNDMLGGDDPGAAVNLEDALPPQMELVEGTLGAPASYEPASRTIRWTGPVPRGGSVEIRFQARLTNSAAEWRSVLNTARLTDAFGRQSEASAQTHIALPVPSATLAPSATSTPAPSATPAPSVTPTPSPTAAPSVTATRPPATPRPTLSPTPAGPESVVPFVYGLVITPDEPPLYYIVVAHVLYRSTDRGLTWAMESLAGVPTRAYVYVAAVDYRHPQTMYLGTDFGLYRREAPDQPWGLVNTLVVTALAVDFVNPDVLWAGTRYGTELYSVLVKSEDRGRTWGKADYGIESGYVGAILVNPNNPNILWAQVRPNRKGSWPAGLVYRGGRSGTWERLALGQFDDPTGGANNLDACSAGGLTYDPNLNALYVGCDITYYHSRTRTYRLLRSLNADAPQSGQVEWSLLAELGVAPNEFAGVNIIRPLAVDAREPKSLFVFMDVTRDYGQPHFKLMVSHDDGQTWEEMAPRGLPGAEPY